MSTPDDRDDEQLVPRVHSGVPRLPFPAPDWRLEIEEQRQREREALASLEEQDG